MRPLVASTISEDAFLKPPLSEKAQLAGDLVMLSSTESPS